MAQQSIMIVEDEAIVSLDIQECLKEFGYAIGGLATSGEKALQLARSTQPALVLMDIRLQGKIDGIDAADQIRADLGIPVVFLTAYADSATLARAKVTEPYGYVLKPFKKVELRTVIELALYRHEIEKRRNLSSVQNERSSKDNSPAFNALISESKRTSLSAAEQEQVISFLKGIEPFKHLEPAILHSTALTCHLEKFKAGEYLVFEGDEKISAFIVFSGRVVLVKSSVSGKDLIVEMLPVADPFGLLLALEKGPTPFSAKAQIDSVIVWLPFKVVSYILDNYPDITRRLIDSVLMRLRKSHDLSRALAHDRVEVRVASALLAMLPNSSQEVSSDGKFEVKLSRQELADMTGTAPETASRVANALERDGVLDLSQAGKVRIVNPERLSELLEVHA